MSFYPLHAIVLIMAKLQMPPGDQQAMQPKPQEKKPEYKASAKLAGKVAIITGGDSGIGKSVALLYAKEGCDVTIVYLNEHPDATDTKQQIESMGQRCLSIPGDIGNQSLCQAIVKQTIDTFGRIDILVNNAAEQHPQKSLADISAEQLEKTFRTNIFSMFFLTTAVLPYLKPGGVIINTTSVTAYRGSPQLLDYSATKGAIVAFTRSLSENLAHQGIRVNGVAPGPIWTPLIVSTFPNEKVDTFGKDTPMHRAGEPSEVAPAYVFLASSDSSYMSGQVLHINGGEIING